jgi:hypothetical protein
MSTVTASVAEILPNLPGYRVKDQPMTIRPVSFEVVDGHMFTRDNALPLLGPGSGTGLGGQGAGGTSTFVPGGLEENSMSSIGSLSRILKSRARSPSRNESSNCTLSFQAYFEETPSFGPEIGQKRIRKCNIMFSVYDGKMTVVEKPQANAGMTQGTIVKKAYVLKPDGTPYTQEDLHVGESIVVYGREYFIIDCDAFTREYMNNYGYEVSQSIDAPSDVFGQSLQRFRFDGDSWGKYHSKRNQNKTFMEAMLGNTVNNKGREGYMKYGTRTLRFQCVWDNTSTLYGDRLHYSLKYYLCDDTLEIFSVPSGSVKEQFTRLLKRSKLPKNAVALRPLGEQLADNCYTWRDFDIGLQLSLFGRCLRIVGTDERTRQFYYENGIFLGEGEPEPVPAVVFHEREVPPPTAFGSEEDSLRSCQGSLLPGPPRVKKQGEDRKLCFFASLLSGGPDDVDRRFVLTFFVQDGTIKVQEPPIRNSGFNGGVFLSRRAVKTESGESLAPHHLFVGCKLQVLKHRFLLLDANESTFRWMEDHRLPRASFYDILDKMRPVVINDALSGAFAGIFRQYEDPANGVPAGNANKDILKAVLTRYNLVDNADGGMSEHELLTIVRANGNKLATFSYTKFIEQIITPTDEYK